MKTEPVDRAAALDTAADRKAACGYAISTMTCACCIHCRHADAFCELGRFSVNLDRGFCRNFNLVASKNGR